MTPQEVAEKVASVAGDVTLTIRRDRSGRLEGPLPLTIDWGKPNPPRRRRGNMRPDAAEVRTRWDAAYRKLRRDKLVEKLDTVAKLMEPPVDVSTLRRWRGWFHLEPPVR